MKSLALRFVGPFSGNPSPASPELDPEERGIRIAAGDARHESGELLVEVDVAYRFPEPFVNSFRDLAAAMVLHVEDSRGGSDAVRLADPTAEGALGDQPNFQGGGKGHPEATFGGWMHFVLAVAVPPPDAGTRLFLHVSLQKYLSNRVTVRLAGGGA